MLARGLSPHLGPASLIQHRTSEGVFFPGIGPIRSRNSEMARILDGLRDRAALGTLIYTGARVGAVSRLQIGDLRDHGNHRALQFAEKGGKSREIPVRHDLDEWVAAYLEGCGLTDAPKASPLFRAGQRRSSPLTERAMSPLAIQLMLKRRLKASGLPEILSPHSFRVLVVTDLLSQNVPLEDVQSTWPGTPTSAPPRSTTGDGGASPATSSSGSPSEGELSRAQQRGWLPLEFLYRLLG